MCKRVTSAALLLAGVVCGQTPAALQPPKEQTLLFKLAGKGCQIYVCQTAAWILKAPSADLYDEKGELAGKHFAGPTWQAKDSSQVKGKITAAEPLPESGAVAWLLLTAVSHEGSGVMAGVQSIQRLETKGGKAPAATCTDKQETMVPYQASYYFYGAR